LKKKEAKKLMIPAGCGTIIAHACRKQKFFGSFFQKRTASSPSPFLPIDATSYFSAY
jgi:hypothetical protein